MPFAHQRRRGNAVFFALSLTTLLGMAALAIDVGFLYASKADMQNALDAAALAGVGYLDGTDEGMEAAVDQAIAWAAKNQVMGEDLALSRGAIALGFLDESGAFVTSNDPSVVDTLQIESNDHTASTFFAAAIFGVAQVPIGSRSAARRAGGAPAGSSSCFLPIALPDCILQEAGAEDLTIQLNSDGNDNAAWANPFGPANASSTSDALQGICDRGTVEVGDPIQLNNGVINSALHTLTDVLNGTGNEETAAWDDATLGALPAPMNGSAVNGNAYGDHTLQGPIMLFADDGGGACASNTKFNQSKPLTGFVWGVIYDVRSTGGAKDKNIRVKLDLTNEYPVGNSTGGIDGANVTASGGGVLVR
jgi:hypothetical protein